MQASSSMHFRSAFLCMLAPLLPADASAGVSSSVGEATASDAGSAHFLSPFGGDASVEGGAISDVAAASFMAAVSVVAEVSGAAAT